MKVECEICGAYTEDPNEIEWAKRYGTCPECMRVRSLFIVEEDESMKEFNIDLVEKIEDEDLEFENEYEVLCFNTDGILVHKYSIEADHLFGALTATEEFFGDDYPNERLSVMRVIIGDYFEDYSI